MTPEGKVKQAVKKILDSHKPDCWYFMPVASAFGAAGTPDFIGVCRGQMFAIETKAGKNKPTAMQNLKMAEIKAAGGVVLVVREGNINSVKEMLGWMYGICEGVE